MLNVVFEPEDTRNISLVHSDHSYLWPNMKCTSNKLKSQTVEDYVKNKVFKHFSRREKTVIKVLI